MSNKLYRVLIGGVPHLLELSEAEARKRQGEPVKLVPTAPVKAKGRGARNKGRTPSNKAAAPVTAPEPVEVGDGAAGADSEGVAPEAEVVEGGVAAAAAADSGDEDW